MSIDAAPGTTIGGTAQGAGNVISGNALAGLSIEGVASRRPGPGQPDRHRQHRHDRPRQRDLRHPAERPRPASRSAAPPPATRTSSRAILGAGIGLYGGHDRHPGAGQPDRHRRHRLKSSGQRNRHPDRRRVVEQHDRRHHLGAPAIPSPSRPASASMSTPRPAPATRSGSTRSFPTRRPGHRPGRRRRDLE